MQTYTVQIYTDNMHYNNVKIYKHHKLKYMTDTPAEDFAVRLPICPLHLQQENFRY